MLIAEGFQLSPQQQRVWALTQNDVDAPFVAAMVVQISGDLDPARLENAVSTVVQNNEILRTTYETIPGTTMPLQVIKEPSVAWSMFSAESNVVTSVREKWQEISRSPFSADDKSTVRAQLLSIKETQHFLFLSLPAINADIETLHLFGQQIQMAYSGDESEEVVQYVMVADWLNELLESEEAEAGIRYWQKQSVDWAAALPFARSGANAFSPFAQNGVRATLSQFSDLAAQYDTDAMTICLACWMAFLWRLNMSHNDDGEPITIGSALNGRNDEELVETMGLLTKYAPVSLHPTATMMFSELLTNLIEQVDDAESWQECFTQSKNETVYPFAFDYAIRPILNSTQTNTFNIIHSQAITEPFGLKLSCCEENGQIAFDVHFDSDRYRLADVKRLLANYEFLLCNALVNPNAPLLDLDILPSAVEQKIINEFNPSSEIPPSAPTVIDAFMSQVETTPDAIALVFEDETLTYAELDKRANQIAHQLIEMGIRPNQRVGLFLGRSIEMIVGLLGIFKAGATYVPLDPAYPAERLRWMASDAAIAAFVTTSELTKSVPLPSVNSVVIDAIIGEAKSHPTNNADPTNTAYIIYTSGSTGQPKGVAVAHGPLAQHCVSAQARYQTSNSDRMLQFAVFNFDASIEQMLVPLMAGAGLYIRPNIVWDATQFANFIAENGITIANLPTAYWHQLTSSWSADEVETQLTSLRLMIVGGEAMLTEYAEQWFALPTDQIELLNVYGPTEGIITATACRVSADFDRTKSTISIGQPLTGRRCLILDEFDRPAPIGIPGELCLAGPLLAETYVNQPEKASAVFVESPVADMGRIYRTGDLATYDDAGNIHFVGRKDHQVKVRGYRIELGEIEAVLANHNAIQQAVVLALDTTSGDKRLVAFLIAADQQEITTDMLRFDLQQSLPDYMIPADFVVLDSLPLNQNGKVDRRALATTDLFQASQQRVYVAPRNPIEQGLADVWADLFGVERVGIDDDFFQLGGHSLIATRLIANVRKTFQVEIPLRSIFASPSVRQLATEVTEAMQDDQMAILPPIAVRDSAERPPVSYGQQRLWLLDQLDPDNATYNMPGLIKLTGTLDSDVLEQSFKQLINRHASLRTAIVVENDQPIQQIFEQVDWSMPIVDLSATPDAAVQSERDRLIAEAIEQPFDLTHPPLLRAELIRESQEKATLIINLHHIVADERSIELLVGELGAIYTANLTGRTVQLPELTLSYADYAAWQRDWLAAGTLSAQLDYWTAQLEDAPALLALPNDHPRPAVQGFNGATFSFELPNGRELKRLSNEQGSTLFMTLLALYQVLLMRYSGQKDVVVGSPIAGRQSAELNDIFGFFVNTICLRANMADNPSFAEHLQAVKQTVLGAYGNQDLPFEKLVETLAPDRALSHSPIFQTMFVLLHNPIERFKLPGVSAEIEPLTTNTTKFDLSLFVNETSDGLSAEFEYNTDLFEAATIAQIADHFTNMLRNIVALGVEQPVNQIELFPPEQAPFINGVVTEPITDCLHQLFESQVSKTPEATALLVNDETISFRTLNERANQLAHLLRETGINPDEPVGLLLERSAELIIGMLAILKAGAAYVPLDPTLPQGRLDYMIADSGMSVIVTQNKFKDLLSLPTVVAVDGDRLRIGGFSAENPTSPSTIDNTAYIMYTSGSTGKPKGVMVTHKGLVNYLTWAIGFYHSGSAIRPTPLHSTIGFDLTVTSLFFPLLTGQPLQIPANDSGFDKLIEQEFANANFGLLKLTPSHLEMLRFVLNPAQANQLAQTFVVGGEALFNSHIDFWQTHAPSTRIVNEYGPTEATVGCCIYEVENTTDYAGAVPIGRPIANSQLYVLNDGLNPVPRGAIGELFIGGHGLAKGYLNRPKLTAEKFVSNPFSDDKTARLYRSGDIVRLRLDGQLEYVGRRDQQIKIRGFRIELGEIEAVIRDHNTIEEAAVLVKGKADNQRLAAFVVSSDKQLDAIGLNRYLATQLPDYMVPATILFLDEMPLNANGKIDRQRLNQIEVVDAGTAAPPATKTEQTIANIWCGLLDIPSASIHDNFFDMGGHSLLATRLLSRIQAQLGVKLPLQTVFEQPTIAGLASTVDGAESTPPLRRITRSRRRDSAEN